MLESGADPNLVNDKGLSPLHKAAFSNYVEIIDVLLSFGAEIDCYDEERHSPLILCCLSGAVEALQYLAALPDPVKGPGFKLIDINEMDSKGQVALHLASSRSNPNIIKGLIRYSEFNYSGSTVYMYIY